MEIHKKKINEIFKKTSKANIKNTESGVHSPKISPYDTLSPKSIHKKVPLKSSNKGNCPIQRNTEGKKYTFNKTSYPTPHDKSAMISYVSTPNQKSFNAEKLKKIRYTKRLTSKTKQIYQSTQEENLSDQIVLVHFFFGNKELTSKSYPSFSSFSSLKQDFISFIQKIGPIKNNFFGFIGFQIIPYNHGFYQIINDNQKTFKSLLQLNIRQITIQPQLTKAKPNYDKLNLSDFQILQYLGCGGFSTVYLAKCQADGNMCALKFIRKDSITSAKKVKMLENEKNILFSIDHPKLVDLYYAFETKNHIVFGLEYCPNGNLYNFLQKARNVSEEDSKYIIKQILQGLQYLHDNGILFRDIKLQNILFDQHGYVKITDFGLSKPQVGQQDITYSYCGSPQYMAPEMLAKCGHSFQVDYYALGILLYELLYGRSPFYAPKKEDIFTAIMNSEPRFPKTPMISKQAKSLIKGLLVKNPLHRIGSLKGVKEILSHPWLRGNCPVKTNTFRFKYENLKISGSDKKKICQELSLDIANHSYEKYFFPKSFVNKILVDQLQKKTIAFERKQKKQKMLKVNSKQKSNRK